MSIGDPTTAKALRRHYEAWDTYRRAPKGFRTLGVGATRVAVLDKYTNVVYKVGDYEANVLEAFTARRLARKSTKSLGFALKIPTTRTWPVDRTRVTAQEFAVNAREAYCPVSDGSWMNETPECTCKRDMCYATVLSRVTEFSGLVDIHAGNVLVDRNDVFWLIDLAY